MFTVTPRGPFDLDRTRRFAYVDKEPPPGDDGVRLAFCRESTWRPAGVHVVQAGKAVRVNGHVGDRAQVERILGLDVDATGFVGVGGRDPVIRRLQQAAPGLRPPQLHSAYEAAAFCILAARRSATQARHLRARLAERLGTVLDVAGQPVVCLPPPDALLDPPPLPGLDDTRRKRLAAVSRAALNGQLDTIALAALPPEDARRRLEQIPGIGPFSSAIVVVRALGHTDYLAGTVTELYALVGQLYRLGHPASLEELAEVAEAWRPWRTWCQLYVRSVGPAVLAGTRPVDG